jgi:hypothetical protein
MKKQCTVIRNILVEDTRAREFKEIQEHLKECADCQQWLREMRGLEMLWKRNHLDLPHREEVVKARQEAMRRIRMRSVPKPLFRGGLKPVTWKVALGASVAVVVFAIGIYLGGALETFQFGMFRGAGQAVPGWIAKAIQSPSAELPQNVQAGWGLPKILAYMVKFDQNAGHRLESVSELSEIADDRVAQEALVYALMNDPNPGIRLWAIKSLAQRPIDNTLQDAYLYALWNDDNDGIRLEAIKALTPVIEDEEVIKILQLVAASDESLGVRFHARNAIRRATEG